MKNNNVLQSFHVVDLLLFRPLCEVFYIVHVTNDWIKFSSDTHA